MTFQAKVDNNRKKERKRKKIEKENEKDKQRDIDKLRVREACRRQKVTKIINR